MRISDWISDVCSSDLKGRNGSGRGHSATHLLTLQCPSLLETAAALPHVTGFPGLGVLRRLRPAAARSADGGPNHLPALAVREVVRTAAVPVFTADRLLRSEMRHGGQGCVSKCR